MFGVGTSVREVLTGASEHKLGLVSLFLYLDPLPSRSGTLLVESMWYVLEPHVKKIGSVQPKTRLLTGSNS